MASMQNDPPPVQVEYTLEFKRNLGTLAKKYRHIRSDVQPVIDQIQGGNFVGDRILVHRMSCSKCVCGTLISPKARAQDIG
jgi:hypothetical protein